jgi:hypothetical protein
MLDGELPPPPVDPAATNVGAIVGLSDGAHLSLTVGIGMYSGRHSHEYAAGPKSGLRSERRGGGGGGEMRVGAN